MLKSKLNLSVVLMGVIVLSLFAAKSAQARPCYASDPAYNNSCSVSGCHDAGGSGRMGIINENTTVDLGVQLDGTIKGPLKTFTVAPGKKVTLSMNVLNGTSKYAVQLKNMEKGGQLVSTANKLVWTAANAAGNVWVKQQNVSPATPPYYTKEGTTACRGITWGSATVAYTFDMQIDANTPPDMYNLTFAVGGQTGDWYQENNFYIEVLCPYALAGDANNDCKVDMLDLALMAQNWLVDCVHSPTHPACVPK